MCYHAEIYKQTAQTQTSIQTDLYCMCLHSLYFTFLCGIDLCLSLFLHPVFGHVSLSVALAWSKLPCNKGQLTWNSSTSQIHYWLWTRCVHAFAWKCVCTLYTAAVVNGSPAICWLQLSVCHAGIKVKYSLSAADHTHTHTQAHTLS